MARCAFGRLGGAQAHTHAHAHAHAVHFPAGHLDVNCLGLCAATEPVLLRQAVSRVSATTSLLRAHAGTTPSAQEGRSVMLLLLLQRCWQQRAAPTCSSRTSPSCAPCCAPPWAWGRPASARSTLTTAACPSSGAASCLAVLVSSSILQYTPCAFSLLGWLYSVRAASPAKLSRVHACLANALQQHWAAASDCQPVGSQPDCIMQLNPVCEQGQHEGRANDDQPQHDVASPHRRRALLSRRSEQQAALCSRAAVCKSGADDTFAEGARRPVPE